MGSDAPPPAAASRWQKPIWYGLCLAALGGTAFWAQHVVADLTTDEQRAMVPVSTVWGMNACFLVGAVGLLCALGALRQRLARRHLWAAGGLAVLGYLACGIAPKTNRIFYDEHIYMQIGQTLAHTGRAEYSTYAKAEYGEFTTINAWVNKQPNGQPYLLSWVYRLAGASEDVSFTAERVAVGITAALFFLALVLLPVPLPAGTALAVPLCYLFTPLVLWWGHTVAVEPTAVLTTIAAIFAASLHARARHPETGEGSLATGTLLAATAAFAAYFRPESLLVFPVVASLLWAVDRRFLEDRVTWAAFGLALALLTPNLLHLWSVRTEDWGAADGHRFGADFLARNLASNVGYFVQQKWFPLAGTLLALGGAGWLARHRRWFGVTALGWFLLSWGIFVLFYAGGYYYGASSRYAVISSASVALLMGIGAAALVQGLRRWPAVLATVGVALLLNWISAMDYVPTLGRESNEARADINFVHEAASKLPSGSLIVAMDPCLWTMLDRNSAQYVTVETQLHHDLLNLSSQYPGGIYLHWDYWVNCQPDLAELWRKIVVEMHAPIVLQTQAEGAKLAIFRLDTPGAIKDAIAANQPRPGGKPPPLDPDDAAAEAAGLRPAAATTTSAAPAAP